MKCQFCQQNPASVHVTEVGQWNGPGHPQNDVSVRHLCEACAKRQDLPFCGPGAAASAKLWQLMSLTAKVEIKTTQVKACGNCGLDLQQLRKKGRVGCSRCYEVFGEELESMVERIHGASEHKGRVPGIANSYEIERQQQIGDLKSRLQRAIDQEQFEIAADLRDQLADLENPKQ
ncbi:MAG: UvrB/UvrC motif-containing protein [Planctomycetota bacterium]